MDCAMWSWISLYLISHEKQKDTAKDLIEIQHLSKAHISKSVDNLKQHGYIELVADEADHRKIHIRMTGKAKPVLEEFEQIRADILERLFAGVTEEERSCFKAGNGQDHEEYSGRTGGMGHEPIWRFWKRNGRTDDNM